MSETTAERRLTLIHGNRRCTCPSGRDYDGSEFAPCDYCEELSYEERLKPLLLRALVGAWSDVDEVRQRAGINVGASPAAWRALNGLADDGLAECNEHLEQYRITDAGRTAIAKATGELS